MAFGYAASCCESLPETEQSPIGQQLIWLVTGIAALGSPFVSLRR